MTKTSISTSLLSVCAMGFMGLVACGSAVAPPGDTDGDAETSTSAGSPTNPTSYTAGMSHPLCFSDRDCLEGYVCDGWSCVPGEGETDFVTDTEVGTGTWMPTDTGDPEPIGCGGEEDCPPHAYCDPLPETPVCRAIPQIPECDVPTPISTFSIQTPALGDVHSLTFVGGAEDREDLVLGHDLGVSVARNGLTTAEPFPGQGTLAPVRGAATGDFSMGAGEQLALLLDGDFNELAVFGVGGEDTFERIAEHDLGPADPVRLRTARNADSALDFIVSFDDGTAVRLRGASEPFAGMDPIPYNVADFVVADLDGDQQGDLVIETDEDGLELVALAGDVNALRGLAKRPGEVRRLAAGGELEEVFAATARDELTLVETIGGDDRRAAIAPALGTRGTPLLLEAGDVDGNGWTDLVLVDGATLAVAYRGTEDFTCYVTAQLPGPPTQIAVGDWTGSGIENIAVSDGVGVQVVTVGGT